MPEAKRQLTVQLTVPVFEKLERLQGLNATTKTQIISDLIQNAEEKEEN